MFFKRVSNVFFLKGVTTMFWVLMYSLRFGNVHLGSRYSFMFSIIWPMLWQFVSRGAVVR